MINSDQLKKELSSDKSALSISVMKVLVKALHEKMKKKGYTFNSLVLHNDIASCKNEWVDFLVHLEKSKKDSSLQTRYQILCKTEEHWSTVDVQISKGKLSFFLLDAANSLPHVFSILDTIYTICPGADIHYCGPNIQQDLESCGYFALDHAISLAKLKDLHQTLPGLRSSKKIALFDNFAEMVEYFIESDPYLLLKGTDKERLLECAKSLNYVRSDYLPLTYGSLLKSIQSLSMYKEKFSTREYLRHNGKKLDDYIMAHTVVSSPSLFAKAKLQNHALRFKKEKLQKIALDYLEVLSEDTEKSELKFT
ncbi:TPA: hypothetical protein ACX87D_002845 [Legionella pneumophila]